jgi:uncharacterized protein
VKARIGASLVILIAIAGASAPAEQRYPVAVDRNVAVKMRDGVILRADIYRPDASGKFPVLVHRQAYGKTYPGVYYAFQFNAAARGYVVVVQDVRGQGESQGDWYPFKYEGQDGYDTVEWAAALPYSNGRVGMWGASYNGAPVLLTAITSPPHLKAIFVDVTPSNYHSQWIYQGGAFCQWGAEGWAIGMYGSHNLHRPSPSIVPPGEWVWSLPLTNYPVPALANPEGLPPYLIDWLSHESYDDYWKQWSIEDHCANITVPAYHVGGWYDIFLGGELKNYTCIKSHGGTEAARTGQRLLVLPGDHAGSDRKIGDVDFGEQAVINQIAIMERWFDFQLRGIANGIENEKPVRLFVMGRNAWRDEDDWPLARAKSTRYYLRSDGTANSVRGDGLLSSDRPPSEPPDSYVYDPADPVPSRGGGTSMLLGPGCFDQRPVEARNDVLVYTTPAFKQDLEVTGPVTLELYASSSAVDTDFTGKLLDVWPDGFAQNLTDGVLRARYRNSLEKPEFMNPGEVYQFTIDLWATSNVFRAGHKLRLEVSSSNFPRFSRNLNTGEPLIYATHMLKATNTVYHDQDHPSALVLPVVPD